MRNHKHIAIHGHRGARGYYPENTILSFIEAIKMGVDAIEMDVVISKDLKVVVSHEAWMNELFCTQPNGNLVEENSGEKYNLYKMPYSEIAEYDCGKRGNKKFPLQQKIAAHKPLFSEVITEVEAFVKKNNLPTVHYNIEIKTEEGKDNLFNPEPKLFAELVYNDIKKYNIHNHSNVQSFDVRILQEMKKIDPSLQMALLVENNEGMEVNLKRLGFLPNTYSPLFKLINDILLKDLHQLGLKLIPWTVNEISDIKKMIEMQVDGIITDYPDRAIDLLKNT